jgi:endonuclease/exonuclease/phosphatase family metal-dependent hydrolase
VTGSLDPAAQVPLVRVVAYNVSGGVDVGAAGAVLAAAEPDVVCLLEAPTGGRTVKLARAAGLEVAARAGRRGGGTAVLVQPDRVTVRATSTLTLTTPRDVRTREATHVIATAGGLRLSVTAVQLGLRPEVRRTNLGELTAYLDSIDLPTVVGADLNESTRGPVATALAARYQDAFAVAGSGPGETYPTVDPSTRQDFVLVDRSLTVRSARVLTAPPADVASHHRAVLAELGATPSDRPTSEPR